jgi:hypothetical protein
MAAYLHGHKPVIHGNLLSKEVSADGGLVLIAELLVDILIHQRGLSHTAIQQEGSSVVLRAVIGVISAKMFLSMAPVHYPDV